MDIKDFLTEQFFAKYEFDVTYQICNSDCESLTIGELFDLADLDRDDIHNVHLGYTEANGCQSLRQAIANQYHSLDPDHVVVLGSPVEGIFLVANTLLNHDDEVIVVTPAYDALTNVFDYVVGHRNVRKWKMSIDNGQSSLDLDVLRSLISPRTKLVVVNFPHNPTGFLPSRAFIDELCGIVESAGIQLFCDEIYFGLVHDQQHQVSSIADVLPGGIVLGGLSKTYGLPGLRAGWLIVQDPQQRNDLVNWKHYTSLCPAAPSQYLAKIALQALPKLQRRSAKIVESNLSLAKSFFSRWNSIFQWIPPMGGTTALVECKGISVTELASRLATEADILILPTVGLGMDDHHFRIGLGRTNFAAGLDHLESWLIKYQGCFSATANPGSDGLL